jgi:D-alanine-D-alanine ligase
VLIEESVEDLVEVTLPLLGRSDPRMALLERPLHKAEFFDFHDKYLAGGKKGSGSSEQYSELPAALEESLADAVRNAALNTWRALGCEGVARIDFLLHGSSGTVYMNEVNTMPGSLYHHNWKAAGVSSAELVGELVRIAKDRHAEGRDVVHTYRSDILQQGGGCKV